MKKIILLVYSVIALQISLRASVYYVAVDGNDSNSGTIHQPFATVQKAQEFVQPGDTVYIRGGVYHITAAQIARQERVYACVSF